MGKRFEIVKDFTVVQPGVSAPPCTVCGLKPADNPYVIRSPFAHVEFTYDHHGRELLADHQLEQCFNCVAESARLIGYVTPETHASLQGKLLHAEAARAKAEHRADAAQKALTSMQEWINEDSK